MSAIGDRQEREIQPADPVARARALGLVAAVVAIMALLAAGSVVFEERLQAWAEGVAYAMVARPNLLFIALLVVMLPLVGVAAYLFMQGSRIVKTERMPYPGQKVIKPTPVIRGKKAVQRGRIVQVIAAIMGLISLAMPFVPPLMLMLMSRGT